MKMHTLLIDFGGVIAEEGFHQGLLAIGKRQGLDPDRFFHDVERIIFDRGYLSGRASEAVFWDAVRRETGVKGSDEELRGEIIRRFSLRPNMLAAMDRLRRAGMQIVMLSDQTNWLEEIDAATGLFGHFDRIFNSYRIHKSKRDPSVFDDVCHDLSVRPDEVLFVDDNAGHIARAASRGLRVHHFTTAADFHEKIEALLERKAEQGSGDS